jgi:hypothetical protein
MFGSKKFTEFINGSGMKMMELKKESLVDKELEKS